MAGIDRFPKKPCRLCKLMGHFPYQCRLNAKKIIKRTPLKKAGKHTKQWLLTRATWIRRNPPPVHGKYWVCYLQIHEWCPRRVSIEDMTLDHVVSRTRDPSLRYKASNLKPACIHCNGEKGSRSLEQVKESMGKKKLNSYFEFAQSEV